MKLFYDDDPGFDGQLQRTVGKAVAGQAEVGEALATAARIPAGDLDAWYREWWATAEHVRAIAEEANAAGHGTTARGAYLRAGEYYRQAFFYRRGDLDDDLAQRAYRAQRDAYLAGAALFDHGFEVVEIPYDGTALTGHFHSPDDSGEPRPTVVSPGGYDGTLLEFWFFVVAGALPRGYNVLCFDGPGQGSSLFEKRLYFRPDYEAVVTPVIDWVLERPDVDPARIALLGVSFGGYLVPRAATAEHRPAALVADPGQLDIGRAATQRLPAELLEKLDDDGAAGDFENLLQLPRLRQLLAPRMAAHGVETVQEYLRAIREFSLADRADRISCPSLIFDSEGDEVASQQGKLLYDSLRCEKEFFLFTDEYGAGGHGHPLAQQLFYQRAFEFLDRVMSGRDSG